MQCNAMQCNAMQVSVHYIQKFRRLLNRYRSDTSQSNQLLSENKLYSLNSTYNYCALKNLQFRFEDKKIEPGDPRYESRFRFKFFSSNLNSQSSSNPIVLTSLGGPRSRFNPHLKFWKCRESNPRPHDQQSYTLTNDTVEFSLSVL